MKNLDFEDIKNSPKPKSYKEGALNKGTTVWPGDIKFIKDNYLQC